MPFGLIITYALLVVSSTSLDALRFIDFDTRLKFYIRYLNNSYVLLFNQLHEGQQLANTILTIHVEHFKITLNNSTTLP